MDISDDSWSIVMKFVPVEFVHVFCKRFIKFQNKAKKLTWPCIRCNYPIYKTETGCYVHTKKKGKLRKICYECNSPYNSDSDDSDHCFNDLDHNGNYYYCPNCKCSVSLGTIRTRYQL